MFIEVSSYICGLSVINYLLNIHMNYEYDLDDLI